MAGRPKHGLWKTRTYKSWTSMKDRCLNPNAANFYKYGAKGITVCPSWLKFENFLKDMGLRPLGRTLDRFPDKDGNYKPGNCRWATFREQNLNRRKYKRVPQLLCKRGHRLLQGPVQKECRICHNETVKRYRERKRNG